MLEADAHMRVTQLRAHGIEDAHTERLDREDAESWVVYWRGPSGEEHESSSPDEVQGWVEGLIAVRADTLGTEAADNEPPTDSMASFLAASSQEGTPGPNLDARCAMCGAPASWRMDSPDGRSDYLCNEHKAEFEAGGTGENTLTWIDAETPSESAPSATDGVPD